MITRTTSNDRTSMRGFSLVELMVALTLSLVLLGGVTAMFVSSRTTYEANDRLARIEESGRFAIDMIVRDLRAAGYVGCSKTSELHTTLNGAAPGDVWDFGSGIIGFNANTGSGWTPAVEDAVAQSPQTGSDVMLLRVPVPGAPALRLTESMVADTDDLSVPKFPAGHEGAFKKNQILMIADCQHRTTFEVTDYDPQAGIIKHEKSDGTEFSPGNDRPSLDWVYMRTSTTVAVQTVAYYVKNSELGIPTLYRRIDQATPQPIVEGVENMQILFGEDTAPADRIADRYVTANTVGLANMKNIITVSIALLVRSPEPYGPASSRSHPVLDQTIAKNDAYMRRVFSTTASVRNVAL